MIQTILTHDSYSSVKIEPIINKDRKDWHVVDFINQSKLSNTSTAERANSALCSSRSSQVRMTPIEVTQKVWQVHCQLCWTVSLFVYCKPQYLSRTSRSVRVHGWCMNCQPEVSRERNLNNLASRVYLKKMGWLLSSVITSCYWWLLFIEPHPWKSN